MNLMHNKISSEVPHKKTAGWYRIYQPRPMASQRIILLPHASGSASFFRQWVTKFPYSVEVVSVQYPGREDRLAEAMIDNMPELIQQLTPAIASKLDKPYILFGHSMGGAVAYELYRSIARSQLPLPEHLVISAIEPPSRHHGGNLHKQDDTALKAELKRLNGTGVDLDAFPELAEMVLPLMRNDYHLIETYTPELPTEPIDTPITVMVGDSDDELQLGDAEAWQQETTNTFDQHVFPGGHFYLILEKTAVIQTLLDLLKEIKHSPHMWPAMP